MAGNDADYELAKIRFKKLYRKAKELQIKDEDINKLIVLQKHLEKKENIVFKIVKIILLSLCCLAVFSVLVYASVVFNIIEGRSIAELSTTFTGGDLDNDQCLVYADEIYLDVFRPPVDCTFCKGVKSFERVSNLSQREFVEKYAYSGRPVIITDATKNWTALNEFSFDFLKSLYQKDSPVLNDGDSENCQFFPYKTKFKSVKHVFKMSEKMKSMQGDPWYIGWSNCDPQAANVLRKYYQRPYFLSPEMESSRTDWLFMGTPGYGAHIHIDSIHHSSWQAQIKGDKEWILEPPPECYYQCEGKMSDIVHQGEIIVLDTNKWFHGTNVVGNELSIVIGSEYD